MSVNRRLTAVIILALLVPILPFAMIGELPGERWLSATDANALTFGITGAGLLAADVLLPIPSSIVGTLLGARLGFSYGFFWAFTGLTAGSLVGYGAGRLALGRLKVDLPATPTLLLLFVSRPVPILAEVLTLAAGATRAPILPFLATCAAGNAIYAAALTGNGAALLPDRLVGPGLALPMALPVIAWLTWKWLEKKQ